MCPFKQFEPRIYEEIKKMRQIDFDFMDNEDPYSKVEDLSDNMTVMPL